MPSFVIKHINYDKKQKILTVSYQSGRVYDYFDVPEEMYEAMQSAASKGAFLNRFIKQNYRFKKVK